MKTFYKIPTLALLLLAGSLTISSRSFGQFIGPIQFNVYDSLQNNATNYFCSVPATYFAYLSAGGNNGGNNIDSVVFHTDWGDGNQEDLSTVPTNSGTSYYTSGIINHTYTAIGTYSPVFIATAYTSGSVYAADTIFRPGGIVVDTCQQLSGMTYADMDNDCSYGGSDVALPWAWMQIVNTSNTPMGYVWTDAYGYYSVMLPINGTYTLHQMSPLSSATYNCTSGPDYTFTMSGPQTHDFALHHATSGFDLAITYLQGWVALNNPSHFYVDLAELNQAGVTVADVSIQVPNGVNVNYCNYSYTMTGNTVNITGIPVQSFQWYWNSYVWINYTANSSVLSLGDTVCFDVNVTPTAGDINLANNSDQYCTVVVNSFDPNNKLVYPSADGMTGNISSGQDLKYTINFQNTGTAAAVNIDVVDTMDSDFDMATFHLEATSHPCNVTFNGHIATFHFTNINLPDSNSNEPESHGFIRYSVQAPWTSPVGTVFDNTAYIYFDNNAPVITNNTQLTVQQLGIETQNTNAQISIYPNPAADKLFLQMTQPGNAMIELVNMEGQRIMYRTVMSELNEIDISSIPAGVYMLRLHSATGTEVHKLVIQ